MFLWCARGLGQSMSESNVRLDPLEDQPDQQHSKGDHPDSDKSRFQDLLSSPLMLWPGVVHYRFLAPGCDRGSQAGPSDLPQCPKALPLELQPKLSEVGEDQPRGPL